MSDELEAIARQLCVQASDGTWDYADFLAGLREAYDLGKKEAEAERDAGVKALRAVRKQIEYDDRTASDIENAIYMIDAALAGAAGVTE